MSYTSEVLALSGLVGYWTLDDAAGSATGVAQGPNASYLGISYLGSNKVDGPQIVQGLGASMAGDGTAAYARVTNNPAAITSAGGNGAIIQPNNFTLGIWCHFPTVPASGGKYIFGRNNNYTLAYTAGKLIQSQVTVASPTNVGTDTGNLATKEQIAAGETWFLCLSWDGKEIRQWLNGRVMRSHLRLGSAITATADRIEFMNVGGNGFSQAYLSGAFMLNRAITGDEAKSLYDAGAMTSIPAGGQSTDFLYDSTPVIASAGQGSLRCATASCGGKRRANEPTIIESGKAYHVGCYGARAHWKPVTAPSSSWTESDYVGNTIKRLYEYLQYDIHRTHAGDAAYLGANGLPAGFFKNDGTQNTSTTIWRSYSGMATAIGILKRHQGLPPESWLVQAAVKMIDAGIANYYNGGAFNTDGTPPFFFPVDLGHALILLKDAVSAEKYTTWLNAMKGYAAFRKGATHEDTFYTNGNIELMDALDLYLLYKATGDSQYLTDFNTQMDFTMSPPQTGNNVGFGWAVVTTPTADDWSDGKGYLVEKGSGPNTTGYTNYDPNYTILQLEMAVRIYELSGDIRAKRMCNAMYNLVMDRTNTTTWIVNGLGGSRQNNNGYFTVALPFFPWHLGRSVTMTTMASHWALGIYQNFQDFILGENVMRSTNYTLGGVLTAASDWPGWG